MRKSLFIPLAFLFFVSEPAAAFLAGDVTLSLDPRAPISGDLVTITLAGEASCPFIDGVEVAAGSITIDLGCDCIIGVPPGPGPFSFDIPVGPLEAGDYLVEVVLIDAFPKPSVVASAELEVSEDLFEPETDVYLEPDTVTDNDLARAIVTGRIGCLRAKLVSVEVVDDTVIIHGEAPFSDFSCLVSVPFAFSADFGPLEPGTYRVEAYVADLSHGGEPRFWGSQELQVTDGPEAVVLHDGRFEVTVEWNDFANQSGLGRPVVGRPSSESALFSFFERDNWEVMVKVLDGCGFNDRWWVFVAAATNVEYTVRVTDLDSGETWTRTNPLGVSSPAVTDVTAFACP